jgi:hypothetical protein
MDDGQTLAETLHFAVTQARAATDSWFDGRVEPTSKNKAAFAEMLASVRQRCAQLPDIQHIAPTLATKFLEMRETLEAIVFVGLASDKIDDVKATLKLGRA